MNQFLIWRHLLDFVAARKRASDQRLALSAFSRLLPTGKQESARLASSSWHKICANCFRRTFVASFVHLVFSSLKPCKCTCERGPHANARRVAAGHRWPCKVVRVWKARSSRQARPIVGEAGRRNSRLDSQTRSHTYIARARTLAHGFYLFALAQF